MSSIVQNGVIQQLSVSQAEKFDPRQVGGCPTKWWFETVHDQKPDQHASQAAGESGHRLFAHYFTHGELPAGRASMKKTVDYAILKGNQPKPGPDMLVEWRGDGQEKFSKHTCQCGHPLIQHRDAKEVASGVVRSKGSCRECKCEAPEHAWLPLLKAKTIWIGGVPWEVFIDLAFNRDGTPTVIDHKFSADPEEYAKPSEEIINTIQMPVYALALVHAGVFPTAPLWRLLHNYNRKTSGLQFFRGDVFSWDQILERKQDLESRVIPQMKQVALATDQRDVPFNRRACEAWHGCPHQSVCHAYKENKVALNPEELALFDDLAAASAETKSPPPEPDEEAAALAALAAAQAKKKAKAEAEAAAAKAKIEAEVAAAAKAKADAEAAAAAPKPRKLQIKPEDMGEAPTPIPDPKSTAGQPDPAGAKGKGKAPTHGPATVTVTVDLATFDRIRGLLG